MKRTLIVFAILFVLVAGGALIAPNFINWDKYKPQILAQLHDITGHEYTIDGSLELAILPYPHVIIDQLTVVTPMPSGDYELLSLEKASAQLGLAPLFKGEIIVNKVLLQKPVFQLEIDANGHASWMTPELQQRTGASSGSGEGITAGLGDAIALKEINIRDGAFSFSDARSGQKLTISDIDATIQGDSLFGPYAVDGTFVYGAHKGKIDLNSGRIDKLAESLSLQLNLSFPDLVSSVTYSGVVAFKNNVLELQGETGVNTPNLQALAQVFSNKAVDPYLNKPLAAKGILTFENKQLAYRNMNFSFAGAEGNGYVVVKNFAKGAKGPLDINLVLESRKPFDLKKLLPEAGRGGSGNNLLPETITLPRDITGAVNIKSAVVQYGGKTYEDVAFSFDSREKGFGSQLSLKAPGGTDIDINSTLGFGARSVSAGTGAVTYSEPALTLETNLASAEPAAFMQVLSSKTLSPNMANILAHNLTAGATLTLKPRSIGFDNGFIKLGETRMNAQGSYIRAQEGGRDLLQVGLTNFGLDVDKWLTIAGGARNPAVASAEKKTDWMALARGVALPFDLDFTADIQSLNWRGLSYSRLAAKGKVIKSQLTLETLQLNSNAGDKFLLAGGVKDVTGLKGIDMSLQANLIDTEATLKSFGFDTTKLPENPGKAEFLAEVKGDTDKLAFTANLNAMRATLEASGKIADILNVPKVSDLTFRLKHPNYVELARIYDPDFNSGVAIKKNLDVFVSMSRKNNIYNFSQLQATVGPTSIKGDIVADVSGSKPAITAALEFTDLPIDELLGIRTAGGSGSVQAQSLPPGSDVRWSRNAINTSILHTANLNLKATANTLGYGNWNFKNVGMNIDLKDGNLDIKQLDGGLYGGHVALTGLLKTSPKERQPLSFAGEILAQGISLEEFVGSFSGSRLVRAKGNVSLQTSLQTSGLSPAALVFDLAGEGTANGENIIFEGFDLARLSRALADPTSSFTENFGRLFDASMEGGTTQFDKLDSVYTITEGVIHFDKLDLTGKDADVVTKGTISLPLWSMDLESTILLKEPKDAPPLRASFKGPIDKPAQTFGQNAMQQYFQKQIEGVILNPLLEELQKDGVLPGGFIGGTQQPQQAAPASQDEQPVTRQEEPSEESGQAASQQKQPEPQQMPPPQAEEKEMTPEDALFGVIQGILGKQ